MASTGQKDKHLVLIGVGPGIGRSVARLFAAKRYNHVTLIARRAEQLKIEQAEVEAAAQSQTLPVKVKTYTVDVADSTSLTNALIDAETALGKPECVYFNAARVVPSRLLGHDAKEIEYDFKLTVSALYVTAQWAMPSLLELVKTDPVARPVFAVTGGVLHVEPDPELFALSLVKAAQRNLVQSLALTYGPLGVRVGMILVRGFVGPDKEESNPENIANRAWEWVSSEDEAPFEITIG
ncbi:NAD(P)-binding protein [Xylaria venustula]|nr:NAD(P)-binding protein [Xylaria venustula]